MIKYDRCLVHGIYIVRETWFTPGNYILEGDKIKGIDEIQTKFNVLYPTTMAPGKYFIDVSNLEEEWFKFELKDTYFYLHTSNQNHYANMKRAILHSHGSDGTLTFIDY